MEQKQRESQVFYKRYRVLILLIEIIVVIKFFSFVKDWVEKYYSEGLYSAISRVQRAITGWLPFSIGDILYLFASCYLAYLVIITIIKIVRLKAKYFKQLNWEKRLRVLMLIYIIFNILWGINYNREQVGKQFGLEVKPYTITDLKLIQVQLLGAVNNSKAAQLSHPVVYPSNSELFRRSKECYYSAEKQFPFLSYHPSSLKRSLFGALGNYLGFSGYYDPFTGEAQVNTTIPKFLLPYTSCHEMAHQLGYAKEMEANFIGYITATSNNDSLFKYSAYLDLYIYATREVAIYDSNFAKASYKQLLPAVKEDLNEVRRFWRNHQNPVEPVISWLYGNYLKANQQPRGIQAYNEVTADLIAYYKKYGKI